MPANKNAVVRYRILDELLSDRHHYYTRKDLLEKDVSFKLKFYYSKRASYENATLSTIQLIPNNAVINDLKQDYQNMKSMIYGYYPDFDLIIECLSKLQEEIHNLVN